MAFKTFTAGTTLPASDVNDYLMEQAVIACTSGTRPGSPNEGMTIYETDTDKTLQYSGSGWVEIARLAAWTTFTPTWTNLTPGSGTNSGRYVQSGKTIHLLVNFVFGSGSAVGSSPSFTLPVNPQSNTPWVPVSCIYRTNAGTRFFGMGVMNSGTVIPLLPNGTGGQTTNPTSTVPFTWATGDSMTVAITYESV